MVGPPRVVAGEVCIRLDRPRRKWGFARPPAPDEDRHSAEIDKDLWSAARDRVGGDRGAEHLHVPIGRRPRIFADYVDVIELECRIVHGFAFHPDRPGGYSSFSGAIINARSLGQNTLKYNSPG